MSAKNPKQSPEGGDEELSAAPGSAQEPQAPELPPEPMTPERVTSWNSYYDKYVMGALLVLVFVSAANRLIVSNIWLHLKSGREVIANRAPVVKDPFSYTRGGGNWFNISWLFDASNAALFDAVRGIVPTEGASAAPAPAPPADQAKAGAAAKPAAAADDDAPEQWGAAAVIGLSALVRALAALALLAIRKPGPGAWWAVVVAVFTLAWAPQLGPVAGIALAGPENWGVLFMALELLIVHQAFRRGRTRLIYALIPLFLIWANADASFLPGLLVLLAYVIGNAIQSRSGVAADPKAVEPAAAPPAVGKAKAFLVVLACAAVCLANPSFRMAYVVAAEPLVQALKPVKDPVTYDQLYSFFRGAYIRFVSYQAKGDPDVMAKRLGEILNRADRAALSIYLSYFMLAVGLGLFSFALNRSRFSLGRFLAFIVMTLLWGVLFNHFRAPFAVVLAAVLILNGQEAYQDIFGVEGRLGRLWALWSTGGRLVTLALLFALVAKLITGYERKGFEGMYGFGFDRDDFAFEAAESLARAKPELEGNVLNLTLAQGDALIWKAQPSVKVFQDHRAEQAYSIGDRKLYFDLKRWLRDDAVEKWRPILDKYKISVVLLNMGLEDRDPQSESTYDRLIQSPNWTPFYDDGNVVMFGRSDLDNADRAYFKARALDPDAQAFKQSAMPARFNRPPYSMSWRDRIFQDRYRKPSQSHVMAAQRALNYPLGSRARPDYVSDPAQCIIAIRQARLALSKKPDDTNAYRILAASYRFLMLQEWALASNIPLRPERMDDIRSLNPNPAVMPLRHRQWITALNFAIQTTPYPDSIEASNALADLNLELFQRYLSVQYIDLARDRLKEVVESAAFAARPKEFRDALTERLKDLNSTVSQIEARIFEGPQTPIDRAQMAIQSSTPGLAIRELVEAEQTGTLLNFVRPTLTDLYNQIGRPDLAYDLMMENPMDQSFFQGDPGMPARRRGETYFLLGDYETGIALWRQRAIPAVQDNRAFLALENTRFGLSGDLVAITKSALQIPNQVSQQAIWEYDLGLCLLEAGRLDAAAAHLTRSIELVPNLNTRPVVVYYLEKLGKPVPPAPAETE